MSNRNFWLPFLLPLAAVLLVPRQHVGKVAIIALGLSVVFGVLMANLRQLKIQNSSFSATLIAFLALAMPIATIGGCIRYSFMNEVSSCEFVLFNGSDQPMDIVFGGKTLHLESRQVVEREIFSDKVALTDPYTGGVSEMPLSQGLRIVAYGEDYMLSVKELQYQRLSFSGTNGNAYSSTWNLRNEMHSFGGDNIVYLPGQKPPNTISRPSHSFPRYFSLSIEKSKSQPEEPRSEEDIMREAVRRAMEKTLESK